ncbi:MAG: hypothetical protein ABSB15_08685 [Bryobacteraceae bacterium]|jgi:hypothetical protein
MKSTAVFSFLVAGALLTAAGTPTPVTFIGHDTVSGALANGGPILTASNPIVQGGHRERPGQVELHEKETDVIYVQDGEV